MFCRCRLGRGRSQRQGNGVFLLNEFGARPVGWLRPRSDPERLRPDSAIGCGRALQSAAAADTMPAAY
eukprot:4771895-Heterocapsa_arctica.AAC.1